MTGFPNLKKGTLNVRLEAEYSLRPHCILRREDRKDGIDEDLYFEYCCLVIGACRVPAVIARTSTNYWGQSVLEIMAEEMLRESYRPQDGDTVNVEVWVEMGAYNNRELGGNNDNHYHGPGGDGPLRSSVRANDDLTL